jgi:hypothetical protein
VYEGGSAANGAELSAVVSASLNGGAQQEKATEDRMSRKLKRPDGWLQEEFVCSTGHLFEDGELVLHDNDANGEYTGKFWFAYTDGRLTRMYTENTAPQWLLAYYEEAVESRLFDDD